MLVALLVAATLLAQSESKPAEPKTLTAAEAKDHVGKQATVCGRVSSARYASFTRGAPTYLNLDKPYPDSLFTVVIWGADRNKFFQDSKGPEVAYLKKRICVTGKITLYRGVPEIVLRDPAQLRPEPPPPAAP